MAVTSDRAQNIILLEARDLYDSLVKTLRTLRGRNQTGPVSTGVGFASGVKFSVGQVPYQILCLSGNSSHPFSYLTLGAIATQCTVQSITAITTAHSLRENLYPGDLAMVRRSSALPYPALFENRAPDSTSQSVDHFDPDPQAIQCIVTHVASNTTLCLWQASLPRVHCGYAKHPTYNGDLMSWAPEQLKLLRDQGLDTISSAAVGVYEARTLMPQAEVICLNQVRSNPNVDSHAQWKRFQPALNQPALTLLQSLIAE